MSTNCTSCNSPYVLIYGFVCGCSENSFQVTNANGSFACLVCSTYISGCYSCTSATNCIKCMNNLILTTPLLCSCPVGTVARTVSIGIICLIITSALAPQSEYCASNMIMNYTTCTCPSYLNLTFDGGLCF